VKMDPIAKALAMREAEEAASSMYLLASSLETLASFCADPRAEVPGPRGAINRRARKLRSMADDLMKGIREALD
jgi:hypothetical protein